MMGITVAISISSTCAKPCSKVINKKCSVFIEYCVVWPKMQKYKSIVVFVLHWYEAPESKKKKIKNEKEKRVFTKLQGTCFSN